MVPNAPWIAPWIIRCALALLVVRLATGCPAPPPPADLTAPTTRATPIGGTYTSVQSVTLGCNDGNGSGCSATYYTTDGSFPTQDSPVYSGPIAITATTQLRFFSVDKEGNQESTKIERYTLNLPAGDRQAPTTTATPAGGTYSAAQSVTLACTDGSGSGCANTYYTVDGSTPTASSTRYTTAIAIAANTTLQFFSVDNAGNAEAVRTATYVIDTQAPTTTATPASGAYSTAQTVTLACADGSGSGCANTYYTTDGSTPTTSSLPYSNPISLFTTTTLQFFSVDRAGNAEPVRTATYTIDTQAPTTTATPAGGTYNAAQSVTLACTDGSGSGCANTYYTTDGSNPTPSSTRYTTPVAIAANTTLKFFSVDRAGNAEAVRTATYVIDTQAPTTTATPAGGAYNTPQAVTLACADGSGTGCASTWYTTDGSTPTTSSLPYVGPISLFTTTTLQFFSVDRAGNAEAVRTATYVIDTQAPTTTATPAGGPFNTTRTIALSCEDDVGSGCADTYYTTDGSTPTASSTRYSTPIAIAASTTLKFFSVDRAGNAEPVRTEAYVLDTQAPTTSASPAGGTFTSLQAVTLSCDDGTGSGCADTYYTTDGSLPTTSSLLYTGPVNIDGNSTLRFFSVDQAGNAGPVTSEVYTISASDTRAPTTVASPPEGTYSTPQSVTLICNDGAGGSGCTSTYYTLNGSDPTTSSARYTAPIAIAANTTLKFFSVDGAGNQEPIRTQRYTFETQAPVTTASPAGGTYYEASLLVTLDCQDGATGSGCANTYYTTNGSTPTRSSRLYTGPLTLTTTTTLKFFSMDRGGNRESVRTEVYTLNNPASTSAQIATVRAAADGFIEQPINGALITYIKPAFGNDPAGFFIQAEQRGPALFVAVTPATLSPAPSVGRRVSFTATRKETVASQVRVTGLTSYLSLSTGTPVNSLRSEVSNVDFTSTTATRDYESELISISGSITSDFSPSGTGHVEAALGTVGTAPNPRLRLRVPTVLRDQLDLVNGCSVTINSPLWRLDTTAQPSIWADGDLVAASCVGPRVVSATTPNSTTVIVNFDRNIRGDSVLTNGSQFTFTGGLTATAAAVSGRSVRLTTNPQTPAAAYQVTVATSVKDLYNTPVDSRANTAEFIGYEAPAVMQLNEIHPNITNSQDLLELYVVQGGRAGGFTVVQEDNTEFTVLATLPALRVATGDIIVVHFNPVGTGYAPSSEVLSKTQFPRSSYANNHDTAWDVYAGAASFAYSHRVVRLLDMDGNVQDAVAFAYPNVSVAPAAYPGHVQRLQAEGHWLPVDCNGVPCTYTSDPTVVRMSANWQINTTDRTFSVRRIRNQNTKAGTDWGLSNSSFGFFNP